MSNPFLSRWAATSKRFFLQCSGERPICKRCKDRGLTCQCAPETHICGPQRKHKQSHLSSEEDTDSPTYNPYNLSTPHLHPRSSLRPAAKLESAEVKPTSHVPHQILGLPLLFNTSSRLIGVVADPRNVKWPAGLSSAIQTGEDANVKVAHY